MKSKIIKFVVDGFVSVAILGLFAVVMASCSKAPPAVQARADAAERAAVLRNLEYFKDKFGLCYTDLTDIDSHGHKTHSITNVPCNRVGL
ncbi:secretion system X pseudopilin PulG-like protein [Novimethylophilus kurashikiensis]|uniref:Secretion system X pseudopilin PulG-like protein n=1 Tax=Novimethylophilus kurashikiensis TaxID=1825523 RepID=A0A2R5FCD6_9PROT|nr:hypothetical protein [Novimethylophilus kurashikiensis]GBG14304.1 secretion system X pseudopilin PulG-like protein [Novimethylophilus kurashikiensis]